MTDFVNRIDSILQKKNLKRAALCSDLELSPTSITDWARRGTVPAADICLRIAEYLGVSVEWLVTGKESSLTSEEKTLLKQWKILTPTRKTPSAPCSTSGKRNTRQGKRTPPTLERLAGNLREIKIGEIFL